MTAVQSATPSATPLFSERELALLTAICDTLAPALNLPDRAALYWRNASDLNIPATMAAILPQVADTASLFELKLALAMLDQPLANSAIAGNARSIVDMPLDERSELLRRWSVSPLPTLRQGFQAFKRLCLFLFYTSTDAQGRNPNWADIHYPDPPPAPAPSPRPIQPLTFTDATILEADVVIVGSGAGGGVVAAELSMAGHSVIVIEKGGYFTDSDFSGRELESTDKLFENRGFLTSRDLSVIVLAGSSLGGGTTVNWSASFRTPDHVLAEWEHSHGVSGFTGAAYQGALDAVSQRINVSTAESHPNFQNAALQRGGEGCGFATGEIARNVRGCEDCGFCNFGCSFGAKQSAVRTFLQDAYQHGARIAVEAQAERIIVERGVAQGVIAQARTPDGRRVPVTIRARVVVAAGGAIQTPALLMRSGLTNLHIGRNLHLHPTTVSYGFYDEPVRGWSGPIMTRYISEFKQLTDGYGVSLQTAPVHPGLAALVLPWQDGFQHKQMMERVAYLANIIIIGRDRYGGQIKLRRDGSPEIHYKLHPFDAAHLQRGMIESLSVHAAAGAREIGSPHVAPHQFTPTGDSTALAAFRERVRSAGMRPNTFALLSAHQMSSARMGGSPAMGAIDPTGESFEVRNLFVADGSALPTALGVNPMLTIMGVAHTLAQHIKAKL